jgi:hypothetical protein
MSKSEGEFWGRIQKTAFLRTFFGFSVPKRNPTLRRIVSQSGECSIKPPCKLFFCMLLIPIYRGKIAFLRV